jgi:hypothetical protein
MPSNADYNALTQLQHMERTARGIAEWEQSRAAAVQRRKDDAKYGEVWRALDQMRRASPNSWNDPSEPLDVEKWARLIASNPSGRGF